MRVIAHDGLRGSRTPRCGEAVPGAIKLTLSALGSDLTANSGHSEGVGATLERLIDERTRM
jgi:hypothetical protein